MPRLVAFAEALFPAAATATSRRKTLIRLLLKYGLSTPVEIGVWRASLFAPPLLLPSPPEASD